MISYEEALRLLRQNEKLSGEKIPLDRLMGRICAQYIYAKTALPPFNNSAMDGFAVRYKDISKASKDNPIGLQIIGSIMAGDDKPKTDWGALEIMTGAPVPEHYDSVVKIEDVKIKNNFAVFYEPVAKNNNIRFAGEDYQKGEIIIGPGTKINAKHIMALAANGIDNIEVVKQPKIMVLSTGKEIIDDANIPLKPSQIRNANSPFLIAALEEMNYQAHYGGLIKDEPKIFEEKLAGAVKSNDIIISTGAVSMGKKDFIPNSLKNLGAKILFHKVAIRPGKPILYAKFANGTHYFGLPGNPVSAFVGLRFFVVPLLNQLSGLDREKPLKAPLSAPFSKKKGFRFFQKAFVSANSQGQLKLEILKGQQSFKIKELVQASCWASIAPAQSELKKGDLVEFYPQIGSKFQIMAEG